MEIQVVEQALSFCEIQQLVILRECPWVGKSKEYSVGGLHCVLKCELQSELCVGLSFKLITMLDRGIGERMRRHGPSSPTRNTGNIPYFSNLTCNHSQTYLIAQVFDREADYTTLGKPLHRVIEPCSVAAFFMIASNPQTISA